MDKNMRVSRVTVEVIADFDVNGNISPLCVIWEDGRKFEVDKVLDVRYACASKAGGTGVRYTCRILGKNKELFYDEPVWFVEAYRQAE